MKLLAIGIGLVVLTSCVSLPSRTSAMAAQTATELNAAATHAVKDVQSAGRLIEHIGMDFSAVVGAVNRIRDAAKETP